MKAAIHSHRKEDFNAWEASSNTEHELSLMVRIKIMTSIGILISATHRLPTTLS
jgi:hypothetical protein